MQPGDPVHAVRVLAPPGPQDAFKGVQWEQGVVNHCILGCFIMQYYPHPLHPPLAAPPFDEYPGPDDHGVPRTEHGGGQHDGLRPLLVLLLSLLFVVVVVVAVLALALASALVLAVALALTLALALALASALLVLSFVYISLSLSPYIYIYICICLSLSLYIYIHIHNTNNSVLLLVV